MKPRHSTCGLIACCVVAVLLAATPAFAQTLDGTAASSTIASPSLSEAGIAAAIKEGTASKKSIAAVAGSDTANNFVVVAQGPYGRVESAAAAAASKYQPFKAEQVTSEMIAPVLAVMVRPGKPGLEGSRWIVTPPVKHVVLRVGAAGDIVQPDKITPFPTEWGNAFGAKFQSQGAIALFDLAKVPQDGDVEVVVITDQFEQVRKIKAKDRQQIR